MPRPSPDPVHAAPGTENETGKHEENGEPRPQDLLGSGLDGEQQLRRIEILGL